VSSAATAFVAVLALVSAIGCTRAAPSPSVSEAPAVTASVRAVPSGASNLPPPPNTPPRDRLVPPAGLSATVVAAPSGRAERVTITPPGITFDVPNPSAGFSATGAKLDALSACKNEWDTEYAQVANAMLPFETLAAHIGSEPFCGGASYFDMHIRAYVVEMPASSWVALAIKRGGEAEAARFGWDVRYRDSEKMASKWAPRFDFPDFTHVGVAYSRFYGDYGGIAHVDTFVRSFGDQTLVLMFMWAKSPVYEADGKRIDPVADVVLSVKKL
jgi:hypothetical protein